jgi:peptide/nickel transport system ATP-binding protein
MTGLLEIENLQVRYGRSRRHPTTPAVDDVTLSVRPGQSVGIVGESGSGKTTIGRAALGLVTPSGGRIRFDGTDITTVPAEQRGPITSDLQVVFQDPYGSLNPTRTISQILTEPLTAHGEMTPTAARQRIDQLLDLVGLPADAASRYPVEFSGGQRQRVAIARALSSQPKLVICDEPVSALDLSTQAQVLNLLADLRTQLGLAYLFIGHNLAVVRHICDDIVVLYRGRVMETGAAAEITARPLHPYTRALVAAAPSPDVATQRERRMLRQASVPARTTPSVGDADTACPFVSRCPQAEPVCTTSRPILTSIETKGNVRNVACHIYEHGSGHSQANDTAQPHPVPGQGGTA